MSADWTPRRVGRMAGHALTYELAIYRGLARWLVRRPDVPAGATPVGYARMVTPVMWLWIFASAAELPAVHFLVPWDAPRLVLLGIGIWGLVWMVGLLASFHVRPHVLAADRLRIRNGPLHDVAVAWTDVRDVRVIEADLPGIRALVVESDVLHVAVSSRTNVRIELREPTTATTHTGHHEVSAIALWADQPRELVAALRERASHV